jgi:hypothetical protein
MQSYIFNFPFRVVLLACIILVLTNLLSCSCDGSNSFSGYTDDGQGGCGLSEPVFPQDNVRYETEAVEFEVVSDNGNTLYGIIRRPRNDLYPEKCFPAVIVIPGGLSPGRTISQEVPWINLAEQGVVIVSFNFQGRGNATNDITSEGEEDYNGFLNQDDLRLVVLYTLDLHNVQYDNVGIFSISYGITAAAGCVGTYPELQAKWLIDVEGPSHSYVTCFEPWSLDSDPTNDLIQLGFNIFGHYSRERDPSVENMSFWDEREAYLYIGGFRGYYLRLQAEWDHAQPPNEFFQDPAFDHPPEWWQNMHAIRMVNAAVEGGVPWVRVNSEEEGNTVNASYDYYNAPTWLSGWSANHPDEPNRSILEMILMPPRQS